MTDNIDDFKSAQKKKANKKVWTKDEILKRAEEERKLFKKIANKEPDNLASGGDMSKILEERDEDE